MAKAGKATAKQTQHSASMFASLSPAKQDLLCIGFLYVITLVLFRGIVFDNAAFAEAGDTAASLSYAHAGEQIKETEGVDVLWMPYFFSGMPTFGNVAYLPHDVSYLQRFGVNVLKLLYLNAKWGWIVVHYLLGGVFMFFLMRVWKFSRAASLLAAITFMLSPYAIGLAGEGHGSKLMALSYLPLVFLLTHVLLERLDLLSFGLFSAAIGTLLLTNHMQIVYYVFIMIGSYLLYNIIMDFKGNKLLVAKRSALFVGAMIVGLLISSYVYLAVYEYATFSIRGGGTAGSTGGLTYDYATNWSWHPQEVLTLAVPSFFGFQVPYYWGTMPFTNSTVYVGIVPVLLSIIALIYKRTRTTVFFALVTMLVFFISFGKHFSILYQLLFSYLPFFNKFRAPAMILHLIAFTFAVLGAYGLEFLMDARDKSKDFNTGNLRKTLLYTLSALGAILVIGFFFKSSIFETLSGSMFSKEGELQELQQQYGQQASQIIPQLKQHRFDLLWKDYVKFVFLFGAAATAIIAFINKRIRAGVFAIVLIAILLVDLIIIDVKFIDPKPARRLEESFQPDATIAYLKQQPGLFRVFPLWNLFMDNTFAYHGITSVGGYSPAKLKIYQTMLDSCMYKGPDPSFPLNMNIVNMLNAKYLVLEGQLPEGRFQLANADPARRRFTYLNPSALPRAFFVKEISVAQIQTEVFAILNSSQFNAGTMAVVEKLLPQEISKPDSASAEITEYQSRSITIKAYTSSPALLVLSEVYYPAGWKAYIDGNEAEIFKTNYILRSVVVPAGNHDIRFKFDPPMYSAGWNLSRAAWAVALLCILIGLWKTPAIRARFTGKKPEQAAPAHG